MATPTFIAEDADDLYTRLLQYEAELVKEAKSISKERSKEIENKIDAFYKEYNKMYPSLHEFEMQDRIDNIKSALHRIQGTATMRWFLNNSNSNSGLNTNSNNNMQGGRKSRNKLKKLNTRKVNTRKVNTRKVNTRKVNTRKVNTRKVRKSHSKK